MKNGFNVKKYTASPATTENNSRNIVLVAVSFMVTLAILLSIGMVIYNHYLYSDTTKPDSSINYEEILLKEAKQQYFIFDETIFSRVEFDPYGMENGIYSIYFDNKIEPYMYQGCDLWIGDKDLSTLNDETTFTTFSLRESCIIQSARDLVCKYIQDSNVLMNKDYLIEKIQSVPIYKYTDSTHPELVSIMDAPAVHMGNAIYCNKAFDEFFCEYMLVHELIHHLRYLTNGEELNNEKFFATVFDEALTDLITQSINPKFFNNPNYTSGYRNFYEPVNDYLSVFEEDGLNAFFYGYDDFVQKYGGKTFNIEHNLFVVALDSYENNPNTPIVCESLVHTWNTRLSEI